MIATVLVTGVAGWLFGWLHARSGSLAAPMLAHLAVNEAGGRCGARPCNGGACVPRRSLAFDRSAGYGSGGAAVRV